MSNIDHTARVPFFPKSRRPKSAPIGPPVIKKTLERNNQERVNEINAETQNHVNVTIPDSIKDYSKIKKMVDSAPEIDHSDKISLLKKQINEGTYKIDYEGLADKLLENEY